MADELEKSGYKLFDTIKTFNSEGIAPNHYKDSLNNVVEIITISTNNYPVQVSYRTPYKDNYKSLLTKLMKSGFTFKTEGRLTSKYKEIMYVGYHTKNVGDKPYYYIQVFSLVLAYLLDIRHELL